MGFNGYFNRIWWDFVGHHFFTHGQAEWLNVSGRSDGLQSRQADESSWYGWNMVKWWSVMVIEWSLNGEIYHVLPKWLVIEWWSINMIWLRNMWNWLCYQSENQTPPALVSLPFPCPQFEQATADTEQQVHASAHSLCPESSGALPWPCVIWGLVVWCLISNLAQTDMCWGLRSGILDLAGWWRDLRVYAYELSLYGYNLCVCELFKYTYIWTDVDNIV